MVTNKFLLYSIYLGMSSKTKTKKTIKTITEEKVEIFENITIELPPISESALKSIDDIDMTAKVEEVKEQVEDKVEEVKEQVEDKVEEVKEQVEDKVEEVKEQVEEKVEEVKEKVEEKVEEVKEVFDKVKEQVQDKVNDIMYDLAEDAKKEADKLIDKLEDKIATELNSVVAEMATNIVEEVNGSKNVCVKCAVSCIFPMLKSALIKPKKPTEVKAQQC
jgi:hypothetical protein